MFYIYCDYNEKTGLGHIKRCIVLAQQLKQIGVNIHFLLLNEKTPVPVTDLLAEFYHEFFDSEAAIYRLLSKTKYRNSALLIDSYLIDSYWEKKFSSAIYTLVLSDNPNRIRYGRCLVDYSLGRVTSEYENLINGSALVLTGWQYNLVDMEYYKTQRNRTGITHIKNILISIGGSDPKGYGYKIIKNIETIALKYNLKITFVGNKKFKYWEKIQTQFPDFLNVIEQPNSLIPFTHKADLAIGAAGVSQSERSINGLPTLLLCLAENQRSIYQAMIGQKLAWPVSQIEKISQTLESFLVDRDHYKALAQRLINTFGLQDPYYFMRSMIKELGLLVLESMRHEDIDLLYQWQTEPGNRAYFSNPKVPTYEEHQVWFDQALQDSRRRLLMITFLGSKVGYIRLDYFDGNRKEVSLLIGKSTQGYGFGQTALKWLCEHYTGLQAHIDERNHSSIKVFSESGFSQNESGVWIA